MFKLFSLHCSLYVTSGIQLKNYKTSEEAGGNIYYNQEKTQSIETDPQRIQLLELADKNFKIIINMFKILEIKKMKRLCISEENYKL